MPNDPYDLLRFVDAQAAVYDRVRAELRAGAKQSHWMWFIFPQLRGLGHSEMAYRFGISSIDEAVAYLKHPILGTRLRECTDLVNAVEAKSTSDIFGYPDDLKFHSSMTLFHTADGDCAAFRLALDKYFGGAADAATLARTGAPSVR